MTPGRLESVRLHPPRESRAWHLLVRALQRLDMPQRWQLRAELAAFRRIDNGELELLAALADPARLALDIGAARGLFSATLRDCGCRVTAFEANPAEADAFRRRLPEVTLHAVALSDREGSARLRVPRGRHGDLPGFGTIEADNPLALEGTTVGETEVPVRRLDSFDLPPVGLIKIDVEGHELEVLKGATGLLARDRPALQVEAEERHRPGAVATTAAFLADFGYEGWALAPEGLRPLAGFVAGRDQVPGQAPYLNTFVFAAGASLQARLDQATRASASAR